MDRQCVSNAVYVLRPSFAINKKMISVKQGLFKKLVKPKYTFEISEVQTQGQGPCPRFLHASTYINSRYLAIYGGRNDKMYQ